MAQERMIPRADSTDGLSDLRRKLAAGRAHSAGRVLTDSELADYDHFREVVALGMAQGMKLIMEDDQLVDSFFERGFAKAIKKSRENAAKWAGTGLFYALIFSFSLWLFSIAARQTGGVK